jgi:hypothetical protein
MMTEPSDVLPLSKLRLYGDVRVDEDDAVIIVMRGKDGEDGEVRQVVASRACVSTSSSAPNGKLLACIGLVPTNIP